MFGFFRKNQKTVEQRRDGLLLINIQTQVSIISIFDELMESPLEDIDRERLQSFAYCLVDHLYLSVGSKKHRELVQELYGQRFFGAHDISKWG